MLAIISFTLVIFMNALVVSLLGEIRCWLVKSFKGQCMIMPFAEMLPSSFICPMFFTGICFFHLMWL